MRTEVKRAVLHLSKWLGLFYVARALTRRDLRILCYHNTTADSEHRHLPKLFIRASTLEKRLRYLRQHDFPVISLNEAVSGLQAGTLPERATVITIDDGWYGTYRHAWPLLRLFNLPATVYVTSYYVAVQKPVFDVAIRYMFSLTRRLRVDLTGLGLPGIAIADLANAAERNGVIDEIVQWGNNESDESTRDELARQLGDRLGVDYQTIVTTRTISLMTTGELRAMADAGIDVQSHTHRHDFPTDGVTAARELDANRAAVEPVVGKRLEHFCYPSGIWSEQHWSYLRAAGFKSATTCDPGFNDRQTPLLALKRFLDGENIAQVEFEAEVSGYTEILRRARRLLRAKLGGPN